MKSQAIEHGQRWLHKGDTIDWRVVSLDVETIGLSGPGLCRSMRYVSPDELLTEWELLPDDERKRKMDARVAAARAGRR